MLKPIKCLNEITAVVATILLIFEQSPANEALRALVGFKVLDITESALMVGLAVGTITFMVELSSGILIALSLNNSLRFKKFSNRFSQKNVQPTDKNSYADYLLALGVGAGSLVIKKHLTSARQNLRTDVKSAVKATLAITVLSTLVGFLAGGGIELARAIGLGTQAQYFLDIATNWKFWLTVVIGSQAFEFANNLRKRKQRQNF